VKVSSQDVIHLYRKSRIGQVRGVSAFAPVMLQAKDLADLQEATIVKARIEACFAGFITSEEGDGALLGPTTDEGVQELQPGMLRHLKPGEEIQFANPTSSVSFDPVMLHTLMGIAVGLGLTYDQLTGDLRQANYSSLRAGKIEMRRLVEQVQYQMVIPMLCRPVWRRFIDMCILTGQLRGTIDDYPCEWIAPAHEAIDPEKDLRADILAVRSGRMTHRQFIAAWGNDPDTHLEQLAADNARLDELGLMLDTDPRRMSSAGQIQHDPAKQEQADQEQAAQEQAAQEQAAQEQAAQAEQERMRLEAILRTIAERPTPQPVVNVSNNIDARPKRSRNIIHARDEKGRILQMEQVHDEGTENEKRELVVITKHDELGRAVEFDKHIVEEAK
jgi:capsid protein